MGNDREKRADAIRRENEAETRRRRKRRKPSLATLRIGDLNRLYRARHGEHLPDDDSGREAFALMAHHLAMLPPEPARRIAEWARLHAPWLTDDERDEIIATILDRPRRFRASRLARLLAVTEDERADNHITTIGCIDRGKGKRSIRRRERRRAYMQRRRRDKGIRPRHEYEAAALARQAPWTALGISRATWYRQKGQHACPSETGL